MNDGSSAEQGLKHSDIDIATKKEADSATHFVRDQFGSTLSKEINPGKFKMVKSSARELSRPTHEGEKSQTVIFSERLDIGDTFKIQLRTQSDPKHFVVIPTPQGYVNHTGSVWKNSVWVKEITSEEFAKAEGKKYQEEDLPIAPPPAK